MRYRCFVDECCGCVFEDFPADVEDPFDGLDADVEFIEDGTAFFTIVGDLSMEFGDDVEIGVVTTFDVVDVKVLLPAMLAPL